MMLSKHEFHRAVLLLIMVLRCIWCSCTTGAELHPERSSSLSSSSTRRALAQGPASAATPKPQFQSVYAAVLRMPEGRVMINTPFNNFLVMGDPGLRAKFQEAFTRTTDPGAHGTCFWPVESAWASITRQLCMSLQQLQDTLAAAPDVAMQYLYINSVNGTTIMSSDFKDGMSLQTMDPGFALQLRKRTVNGSAQWYFPGVGYNSDDVTIQKPDVTAGSAVIHFVNYPIFSPAQRAFWANQAKIMRCGEEGGPAAAAAANATDQQQWHQPQEVNAGMIAGVAIAAAVTMAALVLLLVLLLRKRHITDRLSTAFGVASPQQQQKPCNAAPGAMPFPGGKQHRQHGGGKPPFAGGAGSGSGDAAWLVAGDNPDEAAMLCTPDISQEQDTLHHPAAAAAAAALAGTPLGGYSSLSAPATPQSSAVLNNACSEESAASASQPTAAAPLGGPYPHGEESGMTPVFEPNPTVPESKLAAWMRQFSGSRGLTAAGPAAAAAAGGGGDGQGGAGVSDDTSSSGSSGVRTASFAEQLRRELHPEHGNPNIINNYTNFTREVEHSRTAVYFCDGMHNTRQFALKFYASQEDFKAEMMAYKELGGPSSKFVPVLEMSYPGSSSFPTSVLVFERGQCTLETFAGQRPSYFQQVDIFHQLVSAVQHLHEHGVVHMDLKPSNVVHFPEKFAWKLIDLATVAHIGQPTKVVYTREYVSPEVAQAVVSGAVSITADPSWDLWGIGIIMWELATGQRYFPPEWSMDGGWRMWSALCGFEPLPHETVDISTMRGVDRGVMKLVRRLLQRNPALRPTPMQLLSERLFQARGVTTTQVSQGSSVSHGSAGSGHLSGPHPMGN